MRIEKTEQLASSSKLPPEQAYETAVALYNQYHKQDRIFKELKDFTEYKSFKENQEIKEYKDLHKLWPGLTKDNGQASAEIKKIVVYFMRSTDEASGISPAIPIKACYFIGMYFQKIACFYKEERFYQLFDKLAQQKNPYGYVLLVRAKRQPSIDCSRT